MLSFLFRGLTAERPSGAALFDAVTAEARKPAWYVASAIPDTLDGRFAVLATIMAVVLVRLERDGDAGDALSVALIERFVDVMESEHRELGLGDPTLGKTVRKLVGILAKRTDSWRDADGSWLETTRASLYRGEVDEAALEHSATALKALAGRIDAAPLSELKRGKIA